MSGDGDPALAGRYPQCGGSKGVPAAPNRAYVLWVKPAGPPP